LVPDDRDPIRHRIAEPGGPSEKIRRIRETNAEIDGTSATP